MKGNKGYKREEAKFFKKYVNKGIYVLLSPKSEIIGKLVHVNTDNLTLYIEDEDGNTHTIPYSNRHVVQITFLNHVNVKREKEAAAPNNVNKVEQQNVLQ